MTQPVPFLHSTVIRQVLIKNMRLTSIFVVYSPVNMVSKYMILTKESVPTP